MDFQSLRNSTALGRYDINRRLLEVMGQNDAAQEQVVINTLNAQDKEEDSVISRWQHVVSGRMPLRLEEVIAVLRALEAQGMATPVPADIGIQSPLGQQAFIDAMRLKKADIDTMRAQLQALRDESKAKAGFLTKVFSIFSARDPVGKALEDVAAFDRYCRRNGIAFDAATQSFVAGKKPRSLLDKMIDFRFLVAAMGGCLVGMAAHANGVNLGEHLPAAIANIPALFFGILPYLALPFISLSIFRAFTEKSIIKEWQTFTRFGVTMLVGVLIGLGATSLMSGMLTPIDPATLTGAAQAAGATGAASFSPSQYILHGIALFMGFAGVYKMAKAKMDPSTPEKKGMLARAFNKASGLFINRTTAPGIIRLGKGAEKAGELTDKGFSHYMNFLGIPAIFLMMSNTFSQGGVGQLSQYAGYYMIVTTAMLTCTATIAGAAFAYGCRGKEFKEIAKTFTTAFSISSSAATMPVTKESLKNMGVSAKTRESIVPLGANFNMMGTALYLGTTAACAAMMFGHDLSLMQRFTVIGTAVLMSFGAPGMPSSSMAFLDAVLAKAGLSPSQAQKIYEMIVPADRLFDMGQTALNVTGDMVVALDVERAEKKAAARAPKVE